MSKSNGTKRSVTYARVSSDDRGKDGRNLAGQLEVCKRYALSKGYEIVAELAEDDRGVSGALLDPPELSRAFDMARAGKFDVFVVREIDRLSRGGLVKQFVVEQEFKRLDVQIEYALYQFPDTPEGTFQKTMYAGFAEYERVKIAERNTRGRRQVVKSGRIMLHGNKPPYGYRLSDDGKTLIIYEPEAAIVRLIFSWYVEGDESGKLLATHAIANRLTAMSIPTWADTRPGTFKKHGYGEWSDRIVRNILGCETYKGDWHYGKRNCFTGKVNPREYWLTLEVPSIVSKDVWRRAQEQRKLNTTQSKRNTKREYLVGRRVRCGLCGSSFCGYATTTRGKTYVYYRCSAYMGGVANTTCNIPGFRADHVDAAVWEWVRSFLTDREALECGLDVYQAEGEQKSAPLRGRMDVVDGLLADNRAKVERLLDDYQVGDLLKELMAERASRLQATIDALERERANLIAQLEAQTLTAEQIRTIETFAAEVADGLSIADGDFETRRRLVELLDVQATLTVEDGEKVVYVRCVLGDDALEIVPPHFSKCGVNQWSSTE